MEDAPAAAPPPSLPLFAPSDTPRAHLTPLQRVAAVVLCAAGLAAATVAPLVDTTVRTVQRWRKRSAASAGLESFVDAPRSGRPQETDEALDTAICSFQLVHRFASERDIRLALELDHLSDDTIGRILDRHGLHSHLARHKRRLTEEEMRLRREFAQKFLGKSADWWCTVFFADEKCFTGQGHPGRVFLRRFDDEDPLAPELCAPKLPHPVTHSIWGCFSAAGPGLMMPLEDPLDGPTYAYIVRYYLAKSFEKVFGKGTVERWLIHDTPNVHHTADVRHALGCMGITALPFPPYSPDLNPIENLWADMQRRVDRLHASTPAELKAAVEQVWAETTPAQCEKLARSMPKRLKQVIEVNGHYIHY
jgi:hypothetical protein